MAASQNATTQLKVAMLNDDTHRVAQRMLKVGVRHLPVVHDHELIDGRDA